MSGVSGVPPETPRKGRPRLAASATRRTVNLPPEAMDAISTIRRARKGETTDIAIFLEALKLRADLADHRPDDIRDDVRVMASVRKRLKQNDGGLFVAKLGEPARQEIVVPGF